MINHHKLVSSSTSSSNPFKQGMILDQYLSSMKTISKLQNQEEESVQENLYETSRNVQQRHSRKLINYQIRESDEDNYDESLQAIVNTEEKERKRQRGNNLYKQQFKKSTKLIKASVESVQPEGHKKNNSNYKTRRQSNSPFKQAVKQVLNFSPNKIFSHTLQTNNQWRIHKDPHPKTEISSTIYSKFLKGLHIPSKFPSQQRVKQKQKQSKKKNTQQFEHISKYQKQMFEKHEKYLLGLRIKGVQEKVTLRQVLNDKKRRK